MGEQHTHDHSHQHDHHDHSHGHTHSDLEKLQLLLPHLLKHNQDHADELRKWIEKVKKDAPEGVVAELRAISELSDAMAEHFRKAIDLS